MTHPRPEHDETNEANGRDPGVESVVELDPAEAQAFMERVGEGIHDTPSMDPDTPSIDDVVWEEPEVPSGEPTAGADVGLPSDEELPRVPG